MYETKMERQDRDDPSVNTSRWCDIGVREHPFDVSSINLDDQIAHTNTVYQHQIAHPPPLCTPREKLIQIKFKIFGIFL